jgi:Ti-type conjugative transfer relaxase TraA
MAIYHHTTRMIGRSNGGNPVKALAYIAGVQLADQKTGEIFNFKDKAVEDVQILLPGNAPAWAKEIQKLVGEDREKGLQLLSNIANAAEKRGDGQVYREIEFSLPRELTSEQNKKLAEEYVQDQFCGLGMLAIQGFHTEVCEKTGELNPHCHTFFLTRELTEEGLSPKKNRDWNQRELHEQWREQWAQYASFYLKMHGHDITLDHRSYRDQGLDIEPQVKLGKGVNEQEKRAQTKEEMRRAASSEAKGAEGEKSVDSFQEGSSQKQGFVEAMPATDRVQELRLIQLRNLYRIMRRPETVFDIVTRHHATFMWGDVQKILGRYVDETELFQRLDARLRNSKELLLLKMNGVRDQEGQIEERAIYTTRSMLKAEKELVNTAESLASRHSHAVSSSAVEHGLNRLQEKLQKEGHHLSEDQERAIRHLTAEGQLKCIVGYAGAGKTTALEACRDIWEAEGYRVYGLAPTGRAAQNLEGSGIFSQTLHKFLKAFDEGRSQCSDKSVVILDEAGMVDVGRFETFLGAIQSLGVKAVVVGDSGQLQPVEAGPAFRLVTKRVGVSRLEEVVRQKEEWQREATVLFGKQESQKAIQTYQERSHVHLVDESLPGTHKVEDVLRRYEISARTSGLIFRAIMKDLQEQYPKKNTVFPYVKQHEDYKEFLKWRGIQKEAGKEILGKSDVYRGALEARGLDPFEMARLFVSKEQSKPSQYKEASEILKTKKLDHLIGVERAPHHSVEVRGVAKASLIADWQKTYHEAPHKSILMMAYSNRDVRDLNTQARTYLQTSGVLDKEEITYTITREVEDDFGRRTKLKEERLFSKGDRVVFTRNKADLGVKNGSIGTILSLDKNTIAVELDKGKTLTFSPHLFSFFDQGWAVTIHKSQGTTVDKSFLLASHEMNQNLTYVAMTRHREDVHVYGSTLDFWREEKVSEILAKLGEKLGAADYLDAHSLAKLMKEEDRFLGKLFTRLSDELQAMGAVSKRAFYAVADHFLGQSSERSRERDILLKPETIREEDRAQDLFRKVSAKSSQKFNVNQEKDSGPEYYGASGEAYSGLRSTLNQQKEKINHTIQDVHEDWTHPAFKLADKYKDTFTEGLKLYGEEGAVHYWQSKREAFFKLYEQKIAAVESILTSPVLSYLSDDSKNLTRNVAFEDPDKTLDLLTHLRASKEAELQNSSLKERSESASRQDHPSLEVSAALDKEKPINQEKVSSRWESFEALVQFCENRLWDIIKQENAPLTLERKQRIPLQAERTAEFLLHRHGLEKTPLQPQEMTQLSLRAKYELKRIPEISRELIREWDRDGNFNEDKDGIFAHMIAERLAFIEGRLYLEAKRNGLNPPSNIEELAQKELKIHRQEAKELAKGLSQKYFLSENSALECAKNILRYKETHGEKPSEDQMGQMAEIQKTLEGREPRYASQGFLSHEIAFFKRREADLLFRSVAHDKISKEIDHTHAQARDSLKIIASHIEQDISRVHQRGFSL